MGSSWRLAFVKLSHKSVPLGESTVGESVLRHHTVNSKASSRRIAADSKRVVARPEETRVLPCERRACPLVHDWSEDNEIGDWLFRR